MIAWHPASVPMKDRFVGCLLGGAVGDALGAPYEGLWSHTIPNAEVLLNGFAEFEGYPNGQFTDDTQLNVATVRSILATGSVYPQHIARSISKLFARQEVIGPGGACMSAAQTFIKTRDWTTCGAELGQAGNGTAMRTAVLGLAYLDCPDRLPGKSFLEMDDGEGTGFTPARRRESSTRASSRRSEKMSY